MGSFLNALRLMRVGFVLGREGALALVDPNDLPSGGRVLLRMGRLIERRDAGDGAQRLAKALTRLGPSYVKFGQFLATRPDVVGVRVARDLEQLQDRLPPFRRSRSGLGFDFANDAHLCAPKVSLCRLSHPFPSPP